jgi:IS1 family transposase
MAGAILRVMDRIGNAHRGDVLPHNDWSKAEWEAAFDAVGLKQVEMMTSLGLYTALCADTKLVPCWLVGGRSAGYANRFIADLASRLANRVQLTTDGHRVYLDAVERAFGSDVDYAMLVKLYGNDSEKEVRYSPSVCIGALATPITGTLDKKHISTSFVERQNLTMRMQMRRFTRLTNGFSKKVENHQHMLALYFMYYNFCRVHQTLRVTPAMEAEVSNHIWEIAEVVGLLDRAQKAA